MRIDGYIPSRQKLDLIPTDRSFDELAWGPSLMMARDKEKKADLGNINTNLDFDYLEQDDAYVAPVIEALQKEGDEISSLLATNPNDPRLASKIYNYKTKVDRARGPHGILGRANKNYVDMHNTLSSWDKEHAKDPLEFRNRAKDSISGGYKGMKDEYGNFVGFEPGSASNYYDVNKDIAESLKSATGKIGSIVGGEGASVVIDNSTGHPLFKVVNTNTGQKMDNLTPLLAGEQALLDDYSGRYDANTDRARFAKIQGITPDYIANTANNLVMSQRDSYYSQLPHSSTSYQNVPQEGGTRSGRTQDSTGGIAFPAISEIKNNPKLQKTIDKENDIMSGAFTGGKFDAQAGKKALVDKEKELGPLANFKPDNIWGDIKTSFGGERTDNKFADPQKIWNQYTKEFEPLYNTYKAGKLVVGGKPITTDEQWYNYANQIKQNNASFLDSKTNLSNPELYKNLNTQVYVPKSGKLFKSMEDDEELNWKDFKERYKDNDWDTEKMTSWMDSDGNTIVQVPGKKGQTKDFKIDGIPDQSTSELKQTMKDVKTIFTDYSWTPKEIEEQNKPNVALPVSNNLKLKVVVDPQNPANKSMYFVGKFPVIDENGNDTGNVEWRISKEPATKSELQQIAAFGENTILSTKFK